MFRALLLDLDGTLLDVDMDTFIPHYVSRLIPRVASYVNPERFPEYLMKATALLESDQSTQLNNFDRWMHYFFGMAEVEQQEELLATFERFYEEDFPTLRSLAGPVPGARELIEYGLEQGLDLVVATNPVFPEVAVRERMRWAGIDEYPFNLVTTMERMHFCKPHEGYYREILDYLGRVPAECLMVGDDVKRDLGARRYGNRTFWIHPNPEAKPPEPGCDYRGDLTELLRRLREDDWTPAP